ncbi:hypothetical protein [Streptomyces sp. NRRL F-2580]|uniref:hypothetical protein n=1 Tax=Streptomyces sp. NRRL F-2580 TaxID=1463841 RepID=UPI00099B9979|nr:hypothetical protein [Streptomyces sp. NRRL F-2580]
MPRSAAVSAAAHRGRSRDGAVPGGFRLSLIKGMGNSRGNTESGFIRSVDDAVARFHHGVVAQLGTVEARPGRRG